MATMTHTEELLLKELKAARLAIQKMKAEFIRNEAKAFAAMHAAALAAEIIVQQDTGLLPDGRLRELSEIWAKLDSSRALSLAESTAIRAALQALSTQKH